MTGGTPVRIAVITAGLGDPSSTRMLSDRLAASSVAALSRAGVAAEVDTIELRPIAQDLTAALVSGFSSETLRERMARLAAADAVIAVTPIFSTSYSGLFKMFVDLIDRDALTGVPALLGATAGTARHSLAIDYAIRPLFTYLHADPVPTGVFAATADWGSEADTVATLPSRIERGAAELAERVLARRGLRGPARVAETTPGAGGAAGERGAGTAAAAEAPVSPEASGSAAGRRAAVSPAFDGGFVPFDQLLAR